MLKILKIMMRVISSGKLQMRRARHFPQKIQGHLLSCLWTANLKVPQSLSQWVSDQWWGHLLGCLWTAKKTKGVWVISDKVTYWAVCWQLKSEQKGVYQRKCIIHIHIQAFNAGVTFTRERSKDVCDTYVSSYMKYVISQKSQ